VTFRPAHAVIWLAVLLLVACTGDDDVSGLDGDSTPDIPRLAAVYEGSAGIGAETCTPEASPTGPRGPDSLGVELQIDQEVSVVIATDVENDNHLFTGSVNPSGHVRLEGSVSAVANFATGRFRYFETVTMELEPVDGVDRLAGTIEIETIFANPVSLTVHTACLVTGTIELIEQEE
jgi:hypothetical protein